MLCADAALQRAIESTHAGVSATVTYESDSGIASLLADQRNDASATTAGSTGLVILSVDADLTSSEPVDPSEFRRSMIEAIQSIKNTSGARVIVLNASSYDPTETISNHQLASEPPLSVTAHRLNLEAMRLSFDEGISILDTDRILAELGGQEHIPAFLSYSPTARQAIVDELVSVIADYGFFDDRPILEQVGSPA